MFLCINLDFPTTGHGNFNGLAKAPPNCRIKKLMMVGGGYENTPLSETVDILDEAVHNALELAQLVLVITSFRNDVELVKKLDAFLTAGKIEDLPDVLRGAAQEGRHEPVKARRNQGKAGARSDKTGYAGLPAPRGAVK